MYSYYFILVHLLGVESAVEITSVPVQSSCAFIYFTVVCFHDNNMNFGIAPTSPMIGVDALVLIVAFLVFATVLVFSTIAGVAFIRNDSTIS